MIKRYGRTAASLLFASAFLIGGRATPFLRAVAAEKPQAAQVKSALFGARYVALGSSFASGVGLRPGKPASPGTPARCAQSMINYPTLLAEKLQMVLVDRTCSGARTRNILGPWNEIPPQIDSVTPETRLVTVTIGGNDLNYVNNAFAAVCRAEAALAAKAREATPNTPEIIRTSASEPPQPARACGAFVVPTEADYADDEASLRQIIREIHRRAPNARVVMVQYLSLVPSEGRLCAATPMSAEDAAVLREIGKRLATITVRAAASENAHVLQMNEASANHTPCDPEPWMNGSPPGFTGTDGMRWHLNAAGMRATADGIAYRLTSGNWGEPIEEERPAPPAATEPAPAERPGSAQAAGA